MGQSLGILDDNEPEDAPVSGESFLHAFPLSLRGCGIRMFLGIFRFLVPSSATFEHWRVVHRLVDFYVDRALQDAARHPRQVHRSLMDSLAHQTEDRLELRNQTIQGLMAALDTTALLVSNTMFLLSRSPDTWDRLRTEVKSAGFDALSIEDTKKFKLLRHVLKECKQSEYQFI